MSLKVILLCLLCSIRLFAAPSGIYLEIGAGIGLQNTLDAENTNYLYKRGYNGSLSIGYQADLLRFELEGRYKQDKLYSASAGNLGDISVGGNLVQESQMLNIYYSGYNQSNLVATIGTGIGITSISLKNLSELNMAQKDIKNKNIFSYQAMISVGYMFNKSITFSTEYTYFNTKKSDDFKSNSDNFFTLSLRYLF